MTYKILKGLKVLIWAGIGSAWIGIIGLWWLKFTWAWLFFAAGGFTAILCAMIHYAIIDSVPLRRVCAWCKSLQSEGKEPTSHTLCPACLKEYFPELVEDEEAA